MNLTNRSINLTFGLLVLATAASFAVADSGAIGRFSFAVIMLITAIKAAMILHTFMEVRETAPGVRVFFLVWVGGVATMIAVFHLFGG